MPTGLESLIALLPGATGYGLLGIITALALNHARAADKRWRDEEADHRRTQRKYERAEEQHETERAARRKAEDEAAKVNRENDALRARVERLGGDPDGR